MHLEQIIVYNKLCVLSGLCQEEGKVYPEFALCSSGKKRFYFGS